MVSRIFLLLVLLFTTITVAQEIPPTYEQDPFRQLDELLPTPSDYRAASGAPGHRYWQQRADYDINVRLVEDRNALIGEETITYHNNSPMPLEYLWLQLDQNRFEPDSRDTTTRTTPRLKQFTYKYLGELLIREDFQGGHKITKVTDADDKPLDHAVIETMLRIDLPKSLPSGGQVTFNIGWTYQIIDAKRVRVRSGHEYFEEDGNSIYELAQWFPRMCAYTDVNGWQNKQFIRRGEFSLEFGDYRVAITTPDDHIVSSTGVLQNPDAVLTEQQRERLKQAETAEVPQFIVTPEEAKANEKEKGKGEKTWVFQAENVRDFAWASSRKFIWDAVQHTSHGKDVWCMSYYPNEGEPLWSKYSTHSIMHTLDVYSRYTFPYPYPVAISVNGPVGGMEYPMICFNGPRPDKDGTYSKRIKYGLISVIIHEVGHNYFPMIVNSDERQWTWIDEGINSFLQYLAEKEWETDYPSRRGPAKNMVEYMVSTDQVPIMTNSESILQFGHNAYGKPATALNILRETIMGRELFDYAFKKFSQRWMFKRPEPADLFRTMEDASSIDLDWFWRGWFYTTNHVDIAIDRVHLLDLDSLDPDIEKAEDKAKRDQEPTEITETRNSDVKKRTERYPDLIDFYNHYDPLDVTVNDREEAAKLIKNLKDDEKALLKTQRQFYAIDFKNEGGVIMPIILKVNYENGTEETLRLPAEIWRSNSKRISKLILAKDRIASLQIDPLEETADANLDNNHWPSRPVKSRFKLFKYKDKNPMREAKEAAEAEEKPDRKEEAKPK
ncbi:MAG: aminopeptidase [Verrucomicrobiaceae bacterium]|nr:aminopeptidase [Verrucomicrobiaceae bacterium]